MTVSTQFIIEKDLVNDCIEITLSGLATSPDIKEFYQTLFIETETNNIAEILLDVRLLKLDYDSLEILKTMNQLAAGMQRLKIARVVSSNCHKQMLIQQIADKKQLTMESFTEKARARSWLFD